jgi:hypothetical protein
MMNKQSKRPTHAKDERNNAILKKGNEETKRSGKEHVEKWTTREEIT